MVLDAFRLPRSLRNAVQEKAAREGVSRGTLYREGIRHVLTEGNDR